VTTKYALRVPEEDLSRFINSYRYGSLIATRLTAEAIGSEDARVEPPV
jgi:hypothetical protein